MGPMFFTIKESYKTRLMHRQKEKEDKQKMNKEHAEYSKTLQEKAAAEKKERERMGIGTHSY